MRDGTTIPPKPTASKPMTNIITEVYSKLDNHGKRMAWIAGICVITTTPVAIGTGINNFIQAQVQEQVEALAPVVAEAPAPVVIAEAPAPAPVVTAPPVAPVYEYATASAAKAEMCEAAQQYRGDVAQGYMDNNGARYEINEYAGYLAKNSPADQMDLIRTGKACFGF